VRVIAQDDIRRRIATPRAIAAMREPDRRQPRSQILLDAVHIRCFSMPGSAPISPIHGSCERVQIWRSGRSCSR
jgi:hypothetical protein